MPEQILKEVFLEYDINEANKQLDSTLNYYREQGYYVKQLCTPESCQRIFILFEKKYFE